MAELSALEVFVLAKEIDSALHGTYVKNVYSIGSSQLLRMGKPGGPDSWAVVSPKHGAWVSRRAAERAETTGFTTRLRQELERSRFTSAKQVGGDRIYDLEFGEGDRLRHLILELMPPGNIVVTDSGSKVRACLAEVRSAARRVVLGGPYAPPGQKRKSPAEATGEEVAEMAAHEATAGGVVGRGFSLPRKYVPEVLQRASVDVDAPSASLKGREADVAAAMRGLVRDAHESPSPCACETPRGEEILVVTPRAYHVARTSETVSELCDDLLLQPVLNAEVAARAPTDSRRKELEATVSRLKSEEQGLLAEAGRLRAFAASAGEASSLEDARKFLAPGKVADHGGLSSQASVSSALFDRAKGLEKKASEARKASADLSKKIARAAPSEKPRRLKEIRRPSQEWYEKFRWFYTSGGKLAIGGRDAQSNSLIVKRHLDQGDTVYHADLFGSPFFVLKGGKQQTEEEAGEVAQATVAFSSAWKTGLVSADAYWVESDQVSSSAPSGEYLPRGGFLIRGKKNFRTRNLVETAVGLDSGGRVVSGPESAIRNYTSVYVVLRPQREKGSETAKRVLKDLEAILSPEERSGATVDDVLRTLPSGGGKVLRRHRGAKGLGAPETRNSAP